MHWRCIPRFLSIFLLPGYLLFENYQISYFLSRSTRTTNAVITAPNKPTMANKYPIGKPAPAGSGAGVSEAVGEGDGLGEVVGVGEGVGELEDPGITTVTESAKS